MRSGLSIATAGLLAMAGAAWAAEPAPRALDGHADLSGAWSNASATQLQRPAGVPLKLTEAQARAFADANPMVRAFTGRGEPTNPADGAPRVDDVASTPGNAFWLDPGTSAGRVRGEYRSSWIVEPTDGRLPLTQAGLARAREAPAITNRQDPSGPEDLAPNDRCLIASRGSGGPGMLNNIYNSNYLIVQTPGAVVIVVEMIHDARIIPIFPGKAAAQAGHQPAALASWLGDPVGWWDGDTLVVETTNVALQQGRFGPIFLSPQGRVTERLTRASPAEIDYAFQVEDAVYYTQPWRAEMTLNALKEPIYEYACHEGNYALPNVLAGARASERNGQVKRNEGRE
ncbi:MAG: hypothetical protein ACREE0_20740 [Phenylobacterium sp.]